MSLLLVQTYGSEIITAVITAAQTYEASPIATPANKQIVATIVQDLQIAQTALSQVKSESDAHAIALQVISTAQSVLPIIQPFLGPAALYVPFALAILQAFVMAMPVAPVAPAVVPPVPPVTPAPAA